MKTRPSLLLSSAFLLSGAASLAAPVAHWTFDADGGDASGNGYNATFHGDAGISAGGRIGGALRLDGNGDFASTHNGASSTFDGISGANARSIALWIKAEGGASGITPNDIFLGWGGTSATARNRYDFGLGNSNDNLLRSEINAGFAQTSASGTNFRDGAWHHVMLVYSGGSSVSFYVNGTLYQTLNYSSNPVNTSDLDYGVYIGTGVREGSAVLQLQSAFVGGAGRYWQGFIDDAGIWNTAITATDAALLNGLGRIGNNDLSTLAPAAALWAGALNDTAAINGVTWRKVSGLTGAAGTWSQVGGNNGVGSFIVLDGAGNGLQIVAEPELLTWVGSAGGGTWDAGVTAHWKDALNNPTTFQDFDAVTFDDSATSGSVTLAAGERLPASIAFSNNTLPYTLTGGTWSGTGSLTKSGAADVSLLSDSNFSGYAQISAGTLRIGDGGSTGSLGFASIENNSALVIHRDGTLDFGADIRGTGTLDLTGPGTVILSGSNTHTGATTAVNGTLRVSGGLTSPLTVQAGATLAAGPASGPGNTTLPTLTLSTGSRTAFRAGFTSGDTITVSTPGGLSFGGSHAIDLTPTETWLPSDEFTLFSYDTSFGGNLADLAVGTAPHGSYTIFDDPSTGEILLRVESLDTLVWKGNVDSQWNVNQSANWRIQSSNAPAPFFAYDQVLFDNTASNTLVTLADDVPAGEVVFDFNSPTEYRLHGPGRLAGLGILEKSGTGTLILTTDLDRNLEILGGTVQVGDNGPTGSLNPGPILNDGSLVINRSDDLTLANAIGGVGSLIQQGAGITTLAGASDSYSAGNLAVNGGTLRIGASEASLRLFALNGSRTITVNSGTTLEFRYRNAFGAIPSAPQTKLVIDGGTVKSSNGSAGAVNILQDPVLRNGATLEATKNFGGFGCYQLQGTVTVEGSSPSQITTVEDFITPAGLVTVGNATDNTGITTFEVADASGDSAADLTIHAVIRNSGSNGANVGGLTKTGAGHLLLTAANTYTGATTVASGTLAVSGSLANSPVTVSSGATLAGNGNLGGAVTLQSGATHLLALADTPANQQTRTITGALTLEAGNILTLTAATLPANGTYLLATAAGGITGTPDTVNLPAGITEPASVTIDGNNLVLTVGDAGNDYDDWAGPSGFNLTGGPNDDDDHDGLTNFQEYAFGLNPTSAASVSPHTAPQKTTGTFTYTRRKPSLTGLTYAYQSSTNLGSWTTFTPSVPEASDNGDPVETITVTLPAALLAETKLFLRVRASE